QREAEGSRAAPWHAHAGSSACAAAFLRVARTAVLAGSASGAGNARPFEHLDDGGLHAPRVPGARQGVRRGASAREAQMIVLKRGREKSLKRRRPWIFSGAVERVEGKPDARDTVDVRSKDGEGRAARAVSPP